MKISKLRLRTFYIVSRTDMHAAKDALDRYIYEHGGSHNTQRIIRDTGCQIAYCVTDLCSVPNSQDFIFEVKVQGAATEEVEFE